MVRLYRALRLDKAVQLDRLDKVVRLDGALRLDKAVQLDRLDKVG